MGKLITILETFCGIALVACGIEILVSNLKAYALSKSQPEIPNHVLLKVKEDSIPVTVVTEQGALLVKGLDRYLEQLKPILGSEESVVFEDVNTKHRYLIRKVK